MANSFEGVLSNIPGLAGYLAKEQYNLSANQQYQQQEESSKIKGILSSDNSIEDKIKDLTKAGPSGVLLSQHLLSTQKEQAALADAARQAAVRNPAFVSQFMTKPSAAIQPDPQEAQQSADYGTPQVPAIPAKQGGFDAQAYLNAAAARGGIDPLALAKERLAEAQPKFSPRQSPGYMQNGVWIPTPGGVQENPNVHVKQDTKSPTGWSYADVKTDKILSTGAPAPASSVEPSTIEKNAKAIANYQLPPLTGYSMRSPGAQETMRRVVELNPEYNAQNYAISLKTRNSFSTGVEGRTTRSFNVAIDHLDTLSEATDALKNGNAKRFNQLAQRIGEETGSSTPTNFDAIKGIVAKEIVKSVVGNATAGGVSERQELSNELSRANSPAQLQGAISRYQTLMVGQLKGLKQQYESGLGGKDFEEKFLLPRSREIFSKMQKGANATQGNAVKFLGFE